MNDYKTDSEALFAEYLENRGMTFTYEPRIGSRRPDFLVHGHDQNVIVEVTDIDSRIFPADVGPFDPYAVVRRKINKKAKQVAGAKGRFPVVLILRFLHASPPAELCIPGAMYGNDGYEVPLYSEGDADSGFTGMRPVFLQGAELQPSKNTRISAVAVMEYFNPTWMIAKAEFDRRFGALSKPDQHAFLKTHHEVFDDPKLYTPDLLIPRLDVFCNVHADFPLFMEDFPLGPHDRRWDRRGGVYTCVHEGERFESEVRAHKKGA